MKEEVTVLMTTYNEEKNIFITALESILNQTYQNIKILIVVDNKENKEIIDTIKKYQKMDNRIKFFINQKNMGLANSLNNGIDLIDTEYIARMDADDIAVPERIEKQLNFLKNNINIDFIGSNICYIDYFGNKIKSRKLHSNEYNKISKIMKYMNIFHHPTFFGKTEIFKLFKYRNLKYSQDYDFVCRLLEKKVKITNINEDLLYYRQPMKISDEKLFKQKIIYYCIQEKYKKKKLCDIDIVEYTNYQISKANKEKFFKAIKLYKEALESFKNKRYIKAMRKLIKSFIESKYQRIEILNFIKYYSVR